MLPCRGVKGACTCRENPYKVNLQALSSVLVRGIRPVSLLLRVYYKKRPRLAGEVMHLEDGLNSEPQLANKAPPLWYCSGC